MRKNNETSLVYSCLDYLSKIGIPAWRNNTGGMVKGKKFVKFGEPGSPDIMGILPPSGRMLGVECKMPGKKLSAYQAAWLTRAADNGAAVVVVYSMDDLMIFVDGNFKVFREQLDEIISKAEGFTLEYRT